jgi:hypothetical protein
MYVRALGPASANLPASMRRSPGALPGLRRNLTRRAPLVESLRLRLDVTGGNFPKYDRNPNTGEDPWTATEKLRPVRITLHHGRSTPSRIELTVLPDGATGPTMADGR